MNNLVLSKGLIKGLISLGVRDWVLCPGSHNAPLIFELQRKKGIKLHYHFEERGAAFYALGLSKKSSLPVVVVTTSGTAVSECLPAVTEAHFSGVKLIILSADREEKFIGSGAPQVINQRETLKSHAQYLEVSRFRRSYSLLEKFPLHINIRFSEPLFDQTRKGDSVFLVEKSRKIKPSQQNIDSHLKDKTSPVIVIDKFQGCSKETVLSFIKKLNAPVLAHARSGLLHDIRFKKYIIPFADHVFKKFPPDLVIRIGAVPSTSLWRDLERDSYWQSIPVVNFSDQSFPGLARASKNYSLSKYFPDVRGEYDFARYLTKVKRCGDYLRGRSEYLCDTLPRSEMALIRSVENIYDYDFLYLGNSLPIREWEHCVNPRKKKIIVDGNRGANGIDGQIATFAGMINKKSLCVVGDLTALYDLSSFSLLKNKRSYTVVIVNNNGGRIFERMPYISKRFKGEEKAQFISSHSYSLEKLLRGFGCKVKEIRDILTTSQPVDVLELLPAKNETEKYEREFIKAVQEYVESN